MQRQVIIATLLFNVVIGIVVYQYLHNIVSAISIAVILQVVDMAVINLAYKKKKTSLPPEEKDEEPR